MDFGQGAVAEGFPDCWRWDVGIMGDLEVKGLRFVGSRGTKGGNCKIGFKRGGRDEELSGNVVMCLWVGKR